MKLSRENFRSIIFYNFQQFLAMKLHQESSVYWWWIQLRFPRREFLVTWKWHIPLMWRHNDAAESIFLFFTRKKKIKKIIIIEAVDHSHDQTNFVKVVWNQLVFGKLLMQCAKWYSKIIMWPIVWLRQLLVASGYIQNSTNISLWAKFVHVGS